MHDALAVQITNCHADLQGIELDCPLRQALVCFKDFIELSTSHERHHEVQSLLRLEQVVHAHEERMIARKQDVLLKFGVLDLLKVKQDILTDNFDRILFLRGVTSESGQEDFTKGALT